MVTFFTLLTLIILLIIFIIDLMAMSFAIIVLFMIVGFAYAYHDIRFKLEEKLYRELHASKGCVWTDDAIECMKRIRFFLFDINERERLNDKPADFYLWKIPSDAIRDDVFFVRMCHVLGCEVVIRKVADHDIEEDPDNIELLKVRDKVQKKRV